MIDDLGSWHRIDDLIQLVPILVGTRQEKDHRDIRNPTDTLLRAVEAGLTQIPIIDICSTTLRERLRNRLYSGHLTPKKVLDYIYENQLYYY